VSKNTDKTRLTKQKMTNISTKSVVARRCTHSTNIKGIEMPVDMTIAIDVLSIHYDDELWGPTDPNQFYPLRYIQFNI
jgi:hypothetical protein